MPTRKLRDLPMPCRHPEHNPPSHRVFERGVWQHECPACGHTVTFTVSPPTLSAPSAPLRRDPDGGMLAQPHPVLDMTFKLHKSPHSKGCVLDGMPDEACRGCSGAGPRRVRPVNITADDMARVEDESRKLSEAFRARTAGMERISGDDLRTRVK